MRVRLWGTRGSIPVALTSADVRHKIEQTLALADVKHLCMFHHQPAFDDERIETVLKETIRFEKLTRTEQPLTVTAAYGGMEIEL
jgi:hypothetical protein